jgi:hypothetical protein
MNRKIVAVVVLAFLLVGGVVTLCADESDTFTGVSDFHELTEPSAESDGTLCGDGNGGGIPG